MHGSAATLRRPTSRRRGPVAREVPPPVGDPAPAPSGAPSGAPTRLYWALLFVLLYHGGLLLFGTYRGTYDALIHMFLGDHYARDWFSTWDQRWYTGFTTVSYPPGSHQAIAALSKLTGGLDTAHVVAQIFALLNMTVGIYRFSRLWVGQRAAENASLLFVASSAIAETVHLFGQLPTTFSLGFLLNALPFIRKWAFEGRPLDLLLGTVVLAATTAGHHVTTLFGSVFFLGPVLVAGLLEASRTPLPDEGPVGSPLHVTRRNVKSLVYRRVRRTLPSLGRIALFAPCALGALVIVVLPYWIWSATDPIVQVAIPHGSRANFLEDRNLGLVFFALPWGSSFFVLPYAVIRAVVDRMWPLAASITLLFILGTGGTTPIPKLLLGPAFDILTLDRFTFWAAMMMLPMFGVFVESAETGSIAAWLRRTGGAVMLRSFQVGGILGMVAISLFCATLSNYRPFQPAPIDPDPIVAFMEKDQHERWRFLTLGFGDQMAWLSAQMEAMQVDGNYHSVRRLPELTTTSVERLEGAKYRGISGLGSLQQFLEIPEKYHLKYVFSNDAFYDPLLHFLGWQNIGVLENGIEVWERADIEPLPAVLPVREVPVWQRIMWGTIPPTMLVSALVVLLWTAMGQPGRKPAGRTLGVWGPFRLLDWMLRRWLDHNPILEGPAPAEPPLPWGRRVHDRVRARLARPISRRRRTTRLVAIGLVFAALVGNTAREVVVPPTPEEVVAGYYDDLDFRRFRSAYERLDPETRPDYELWRLQLSVNGGLLASYAKLDGILTEEVDPSPDVSTRTEVRADLRYLTALDWYPVQETVELIEREGSWFIVADEPDIVVPPDQLTRQASVDYLIAGRRRATSATSELADIQDRPQLLISDVRLLEVDGLPVVVGQVGNADVDPADITVTAILRDSDDEILARYNMTEYSMRTLNPRETTSFRIDFEEAAAGTDLDFDPLDFSPITLEADIARVEVYAKAVVTQRNLYRSLVTDSLEVDERGDGGDRLDGVVRNTGLKEATIPKILLTYFDEEGQVIWVDRFYMEAAVRPQRTQPFTMPIVPLDDIRVVDDVQLDVYGNGIGEAEATVQPPTPMIGRPDGTSLRIDVTTMLQDFS